MIYFYFAKMQKGNEKIRGKAATLEMLNWWIAEQIKLGFELVGAIETV